jgi:poly(3-hydroxybutyrate) depolymerase
VTRSGGKTVASRQLQRGWSVLAALILGATTAAAAGQAPAPGKVVRLSLQADGRAVSYSVFVPRHVTAPASAPLLVLFHGSGRDAASIVEPWKRLAEKEGIVLVAPEAANPQGWQVPLDGPAPLCRLVDELKRTLTAIDPRRVYLFGHSAGAVFLLYMALLESEYFAAGALHAGAFRSAEEYGDIDAATRKIPLAITVGDSDRFFSLAEVKATAAALEKAGMPTQLEIIKNHDHNYYLMSDKVNAWAWAALKDRRLEADPAYTPRVFR